MASLTHYKVDNYKVDNKVDTYKVTNKQPFDSLGLFTYLRTYARRHDETNPNSTVESWEECITRVVNATNTHSQMKNVKKYLTFCIT